VIAILTVDQSSRHAATGSQTTDRERKATQYDTSEKERKATQHDTSEEAARVLGVQTSTWSSAEREALRRLWCLRHEWERYTEGETGG
jgi:hypothetical protein